MSLKPLVDEANALQEQSAILRKSVDCYLQKIQAIARTDTDNLTSEEKTDQISQLNELLGRTKQNISELLKIDAKEHELKERLNTKYGYNIPPSHRYSWADFPFLSDDD